MGNKPALRIAVTGEGPNDYGCPDGYSGWKPGAVQPILAKMTKGQGEFVAIPKIRSKERVLTNIGLKHRHKLRGPGIGLLHIADKVRGRGFSCLIFFADLDKTSGEEASKNECKRRFRDFMADLKPAMEWFEEQTGLTVIPMVPGRMIECWLMADEKAFESAFGTEPKVPQLPKEPELVWGDKDNPVSNYPKHFLRRVLAQYGLDYSTDTMVAIAENTSPETMSKRCPISFPAFQRAMEDFMRSQESA